jgi:hypothetical protein
MIKEFTYTSSKGTRDRKVFVLKENDHYLEGLDLDLLSPADADFIVNTYKDLKPAAGYDDKVVLDNFNPEWNKAYRQFAQIKIVPKRKLIND